MAFVGVCALGLWSGQALSQIGPPPALPTLPTITVPTIPALPPAPPVPLPVPVPVPTPVTKPPPPAAPQPASSGQSRSAPAGSPSAPSGGGPTTSSSTQSSQARGTSGGTAQAGSDRSRPAPKVSRFRTSRKWLPARGPARRKGSILSFRLSRPDAIVFTVIQISPGCSNSGAFRVDAGAGLNRIRFRGRIGKYVLPPGTYRIGARPARGSVVRYVTIAILTNHAASPADVRAARSANACRQVEQAPVWVSKPAPSGVVRTPPPGQASAKESAASGKGKDSGSSKFAGRSPDSPDLLGSLEGAGASPEPVPTTPRREALGAQFSKGTAAESVNPLLIASLGLAILLLAFAAVPQAAVPSPRVTQMLVYRRPMIALAGLSTLVAAIIVYVAT